MSYIQFEKEMTVESVTAKAMEYIKHYEERLTIYRALEPILKKWEGKKINKRLETQVKEALPGFTVYYEPTKLTFWKKEYSERQTFYLGDECDGKLQKNTQECEAALAKQEASLEQIPDLVKAWNAGLEQLKKVNKEAEKYGLEYVIEIGRG
jgi:hypothetical protein